MMTPSPSVSIKKGFASRTSNAYIGNSPLSWPFRWDLQSLTFPTRVPVERTPSSVRAKFAMTLTNGRRRPLYGFGPSRLLSETSSLRNQARPVCSRPIQKQIEIRYGNDFSPIPGQQHTNVAGTPVSCHPLMEAACCCSTWRRNHRTAWQFDDRSRPHQASTSRTTSPCTLVSRRSMPLW